MMGADSVAYHRETIIERGDDFPGAGLEYYASRGETPLLWGGMGAESLGLVGPVDSPSYDAIYGPGGACDPRTGERLVNAKRPGMELVIAAHKSVAELGVLGRMDDMHAIMDAERDATLGYLDQLTQERGGRRGVAAVPTATTGLVYAHARHATTRAGDPGPHDHVLIANLIEMLDEKRRHQGPRHHPLAGAPPRRHHGRTGGLGQESRRARLRHRGRPRTLRASSATGRSRASPRRPWPSTPSAPRRSTRRWPRRASTPTRPAGGRP